MFSAAINTKEFESNWFNQTIEARINIINNIARNIQIRVILQRFQALGKHLSNADDNTKNCLDWAVEVFENTDKGYNGGIIEQMKQLSVATAEKIEHDLNKLIKSAELITITKTQLSLWQDLCLWLKIIYVIEDKKNDYKDKDDLFLKAKTGMTKKDIARFYASLAKEIQERIDTFLQSDENNKNEKTDSESFYSAQNSDEEDEEFEFVSDESHPFLLLRDTLRDNADIENKVSTYFREEFFRKMNEQLNAYVKNSLFFDRMHASKVREIQENITIDTKPSVIVDILYMAWIDLTNKKSTNLLPRIEILLNLANNKTFEVLRSSEQALPTHRL